MNLASGLRARIGRAFLLAAAACFSGQAAADVLVASQNSLHLGQGSRSVPGYIPAKNIFIQALADWPVNDLPQLTFLQEVMRQADEAAIRPAGASVTFGRLKGLSSYVERYGLILVNDEDANIAILCYVDTADLVSPGFRMERPPDAVLVRDSSSRTPHLLWFLNFHAVFGRNAGARRAEAAEIGMIIWRLRARAPAGCPATTRNVVAMGDWNLPATDRGFTDLARNAGFGQPLVAPNALTSLNARGVRASAYDHFVWDDALVEVVPANLPVQPLCGTNAGFVAGILTPASTLSFRQRCSDHLGIAARVRVR